MKQRSGVSVPQRYNFMEAEEVQLNERTIDFMDQSVFPIKSLYAQKKNPKKEIAEKLTFVSLDNEAIIASVIDKMKDTVG